MLQFDTFKRPKPQPVESRKKGRLVLGGYARMPGPAKVEPAQVYVICVVILGCAHVTAMLPYQAYDEDRDIDRDNLESQVVMYKE